MTISKIGVLNNGILMVAILFSVGLANVGLAEEQPKIKQVNVFKMSLEELTDIEVFSASRQNQKLNLTSVPMSVITKEDIHYSGVTNIYEILQFSPSIDMLRVDRTRYATGIRGLHDTYSDRTLVLINGRMAENSFYGGSEFLRQPLQMEDIERIEVVRGPGGAAWGANAFNGVINVITKKPEDCLGLLMSTQWNVFGDNYQQFRWAGQNKQWSWRISGGWNQQESSSDALDTTFTSPLTGEFRSRDFSRTSILDAEFVNHLSKETDLLFGIGRSYMDQGSFEISRVLLRENGFQETIRSFAKLQTQFDETSNGYIQWTGNYANTMWPSAAGYNTYDNDLESQLTFSPLENHTTTLGGNVRATKLDQDRIYNESLRFIDNPLEEYSGGVFLIDRWQATDKLSLEGQIRQDYSDNTGADWSTRLAAIYVLNDEIKENIRVAFARSYRAPKAQPRESGFQQYPVLPGVYGFTLNNNENLKNEGLQSYEIGYDRDVVKDVHFSTNFYMQRYSDLIGYVTEEGVFPGTSVVTPLNGAGADAFGSENELTWRGKNVSISAWYALNKFQPDNKTLGLNTTQQIRAFTPAEHKAGITTRFFLQNNFVINTNCRYSSFTNSSYGAVADAPETFVVDLTLSKAFKIDKAAGEVLIGVSDLFNETERAVQNVGSLAYSHETPGRIFFARLQMQF